MAKRQPTIYKPSAKLDPQTRRSVESVREALEIFQGRRGDKKDRAITFRDLDRNGDLFKGIRNILDGSLDDLLNPDLGEVPNIAEFDVSPRLSYIACTWGYPQNSRNFMGTFIYRAQVYYNATTGEFFSDPEMTQVVQRPGLNKETMFIGATAGSRFFDEQVTAGQWYIYWGHHVGQDGSSGALSSTEGTLVQLDSARFDDIYTGLQDRLNNTQDALSSIRENVLENISGILDTAREEVDRHKAVALEKQERKTQIVNAVEQIETDNQALVTQVNTISANLDTEIADRQAAITSVESALATETSARVSQINQLTTRISDEETLRASEILRVDTAISDESSTRASQVSSLNSRVTTAEGDISANATSITSTQADVSGNASAISSLQLDVSGLNSDLSAAVLRIDAVEIDASNNAAAISAVETDITHPTTGLSALSTRINAVQADADGNTSAIAALDTRVDSNESFASAQLVLNSSYESDIDTLDARVFLGTNVNNQVTGLVISGAEQIIEFMGDKIRFIRPNNGTIAFQWSATRNEFIFDGDIIGGNIEAVDILGSTITLDAGYLRTADSGYAGVRTVIGAGGYSLWAGTGIQTDANAVFYVKENGAGYIDRGFITGKTSEAKTDSGTASATVSHVSEGNAVQISFDVSNTGFISGNHEGIAFETQIEVRRGTTVLKTATYAGFGQTYDQELDRTRIIVAGSGSTIDTLTSSGTRTYTVIMTSYDGRLIEQSSITTFENYL